MRAWFSAQLDAFQAKFPPNRLVALAMVVLLPTVITPAAGYLAVWVPQHFPGLPTFTATQLTAYGIAGASAALLAGVTAGYKWLDGWQRHEQRTQGIGFYHAGLVDARDLPADRKWVPTNGDPSQSVMAAELGPLDMAAAREAQLNREHELKLAIIRTADSPWQAQEALAEFEGNKSATPSPESPPGAVGGLQPPAPPVPAPETQEGSPAPPQAPEPQGPEIVPPSDGGPASVGSPDWTPAIGEPDPTAHSVPPEPPAPPDERPVS